MRPPTPMDKLMDALASDKELELPMDPQFYERLHAKIMDEVDKQEMAPAPWFQTPRRILRSHWRSWAVVGTSLGSLILTAHLAAHSLTAALTQAPAVIAAQQEDRLLEEAVASPESLSFSVLVSEAPSEFFVDVASHSFENLSIDKFNRIMGEERN